MTVFCDYCDNVFFSSIFPSWLSEVVNNTIHFYELIFLSCRIRESSLVIVVHLMVLLYFKSLFFSSSFRFTAKLGDCYRDISHNPGYTHAQLLPYPHPSPVCPKCVVHIGIHPGCCVSYGTRQINNTYSSLLYHTVYVYSPIKYLVLCTFIPPSSGYWKPLRFLFSPQFCLFQNVIYLESYSMWSIQIDFFYLVAYT